MCWNNQQSTMFEICFTSREREAERTTRRRGETDDGQLAFLCDSTAKGDIAISAYWIRFYWNVHQTSSRRFHSEFKLEHLSIPHFPRWNQPRVRHSCKLPNQDSVRFLFRSTEVQILKSHFVVVAVTCWIVFHMWIIYIGEGCIYSPFLIKHPQPLRSYLENVSQYPQLKPSTTNRPHVYNKHASSDFVLSLLHIRNHHNLHKWPERIHKLNPCKGKWEVKWVFIEVQVIWKHGNQS